jgi:putative Mg2+ transporter-C (MgtC) family protein
MERHPRSPRLLVALVLALPIGWNRARAERGAGLRTFPLVAMASCGFVQTAVSVLGHGVVNQANILQGVITGVGFIGAGAIIKRGRRRYRARHCGQRLDCRDNRRGGRYGYYDIGLILAAANLTVLVLRARFRASLSASESDAHGIAQIVRVGWYREVAVKSMDSHAVRAVLVAERSL